VRNDGKTRNLASQLADERALRVQAEEANRIKDEFLATLSHELRTPLNAITGWAHLLQAGTLGPSEQGRAVDTILRNAKQQARLIEDLLDVSRIISGKLLLTLSPLDLAKVIEAAIEAVTPAALAKQLRISVESTGPHQVNGDAARLQQVVANLLNNSIKFCEPGGQIVIRTQREGRRVLLQVIDDGRGIAAEFLPLLFERFRQATPPIARARGSGLGLGLAIARYLVDAHHGSIRAESAGEGRGATFTISLPLLSSGNSVPPATEPAPQSNRQLSGAYILVVDDDPDALELVGILLRREGAEVTLVSSAKAARDSLRARQPDAIVCDIGMPEEDGFTFMRRLRASGERAGAFIPALALTGHASAEDSRVALLAGFQMHVSKPLDPPRLLDSLIKLWRRGVTRIP